MWWLTAPRPCPVLPLAVGAAPLAAHQGMVSDIEVLPRRPEQLEAIPQRERTAETPTVRNLCPVFAIHQIRALALGEQLQPTIHTETEAKAAHAARVHGIFSAPRSTLLQRVGNPPGPWAAAGRNREHTLMNTQDRPAPPDAAHACPARRSRPPDLQ